MALRPGCLLSSIAFLNSASGYRLPAHRNEVYQSARSFSKGFSYPVRKGRHGGCKSQADEAGSGEQQKRTHHAQSRSCFGFCACIGGQAVVAECHCQKSTSNYRKSTSKYQSYRDWRRTPSRTAALEVNSDQSGIWIRIYRALTRIGRQNTVPEELEPVLEQRPRLLRPVRRQPAEHHHHLPSEASLSGGPSGYGLEIRRHQRPPAPSMASCQCDIECRIRNAAF